MKIEQIGLPSINPLPANSVWIFRRGSWAATRFGLYRNKARETFARKKFSTEQKKAYRDMYLYELGELIPVDVTRFIKFLNDQKIQYEVI